MIVCDRPLGRVTPAVWLLYLGVWLRSFAGWPLYSSSFAILWAA